MRKIVLAMGLGFILSACEERRELLNNLEETIAVEDLLMDPIYSDASFPEELDAFQEMEESLFPADTWRIMAPSSRPKSSGKKTVTGTIVISKSGTYDFKSVLHIWKGTGWSCSGERENGPQILRIQASNVVVKNFHYVGDGKTEGSKGLGDPVHVATCGRGQGNLCSGRQSNVVIDGLVGHACEDLLTVGTPGNSNITVRNSYLIATPSKSAWDKTVQVNFGQNITLDNNTFVGGARCIRFKPNTSGTVTNNLFRGCETALLASSNDADISPMKNGPTRVVYKGNRCDGCGRETRTVGSEAKIIR